MRELIKKARDRQAEIKRLQQELSDLSKPMLTDTALMPWVFDKVKQCTQGLTLYEKRLIFTLLAVYLYSPATTIGDAKICRGIRHWIGRAMHKHDSDVSRVFYQALWRYERDQKFRDLAEKAEKMIENDLIRHQRPFGDIFGTKMLDSQK